MNQPVPDDGAQQHMLVLAKNYLEKSIPKLPDFYATRTTIRYNDTPPQFNDGKTSVDFQSLHVAELSRSESSTVTETKLWNRRAQSPRIQATNT